MSNFKFSVGPWNVHTGADSYGPETRKPIDLEEKFKKFAELGFSAVQFHDDDAVPNINNMSEQEIKEYAANVKKLLDKYNLKAEESIFIDDSTLNVEGAVYCGMKGIVFHGDYQEVRDKLIDNGVNISRENRITIR